MLTTLRTITFVYAPQEDRILAAINAGNTDAWSCWLTRRLALAVLQRATHYLDSMSGLAQRAPAGLRDEALTFEREAAIAKTASAMSRTPSDILKSSTVGAVLAEQLTISPKGRVFRVELRGQSGAGVAGTMNRDELQRVLQMLHVAVRKSGWFAVPDAAASGVAAAGAKPARH